MTTKKVSSTNTRDKAKQPKTTRTNNCKGSPSPGRRIQMLDQKINAPRWNARSVVVSKSSLTQITLSVTSDTLSSSTFSRKCLASRWIWIVARSSRETYKRALPTESSFPREYWLCVRATYCCLLPVGNKEIVCCLLETCTCRHCVSLPVACWKDEKKRMLLVCSPSCI